MSEYQSSSWRQPNDWRKPAASDVTGRPDSYKWANSEWRSGISTFPDQQPASSSACSPATDAPDALGEGRRIHLGNLLYTVRPHEIEAMLETNGFRNYEKISISIDAVTGRNPGYCFVEFPSRDDAERALNSLAGVMIHDRPVKVGPCHPKRNRRDDGEYKPTFQRWGDWSGERKEARRDEQGPYGALRHMSEVFSKHDARLYVGGLGKMINQEENDREIREYFRGFDVTAISKRITPFRPRETRNRRENLHYCFVDFATRQEAEAARIAVNGKVVAGGRLRVAFAHGIPEKLNPHRVFSTDHGHEQGVDGEREGDRYTR